MDNVSKSL